jgi:bifunctional UDP-N-acetylglucosamine pyrophosphorylase/glucosamine-1-phosphate N-acetyltransferase
MSLPGIVEAGQFSELLAPQADPSRWTALIAAAGRGSRLDYDKPKILFPIAGRPILDWLTELLAPLCARFVFVLSPDGAVQIQPVLEQALPGRFRIAVQPVPAGMADAVARGLPAVETNRALIVWGDQVALRQSSVETCMRLLDGPGRFACVCPTVIHSHPYIHFERDGQGRLLRILQRREGDPMPEIGESDSGVFFFDTQVLKRALPQLLRSNQYAGRATGEVNFLPILTTLDECEPLLCPRIMSEDECVGVNSREDAAFVERVLSARSPVPPR